MTIKVDANTSSAENKVRSLGDVLRNTAGSLGRIGGPAGALGRAFGGMAAGLSLMGAAAGAAALGINAVVAQSERAVRVAQEQVTWAQKLNAAIAAGRKGQDALAMGGLGQAMQQRRLLAAGGSNADVDNIVKRGVDPADALASAVMWNEQGRNVEQLEAAMMVYATGAGKLQDILKAQKRIGGDTSPNSLVRTRIEALGQQLTPETFRQSDQAFNRMAEMGWGSGRANNINRAVSAAGQVAVVQGDKLLSGATADAAEREAHHQAHAVAALDAQHRPGAGVGALGDCHLVAVGRSRHLRAAHVHVEGAHGGLLSWPVPVVMRRDTRPDGILKNDCLM